MTTRRSTSNPGASACCCGIELGGSQVRLGLVGSRGDVLARARLQTGSPSTTLAAIGAQVARWIKVHAVRGIGIGSFGPIGVQQAAANHGVIGRSSPKRAWRGVAVRDALIEAIPGVRVSVDTDVNAAAYGESQFGAGAGFDPVVYVTVGTGIGAGVIVHGEPLHGLQHPEWGHVGVRRAVSDDFTSLCPTHSDCVEGLASGAAARQRFGCELRDLDHDHPGRALIAGYLAQALRGLVLTVAPQRIIIGGGALQDGRLLPLVRAALRVELNGYLGHPALNSEIEQYIVAPELGADAGVVGAAALAMR